MIVEIACGNFESVLNAQGAGADRIEVCSALSVGGITPSFGLVKKAISLFSKNTFVLIRPREGNFIYSDEEFEIILDDIHLVKQMGVGGIISGALLSNNKIDVEKTKAMIDASGELPFTFHRAFDLIPDPFTGMEALVDLGVKRILTSGQKANALDGKELLKKLVELAQDDITILAGAGINPKNVVELVEYTNVKEIHLSAKHRSGSQAAVAMGSSDNGTYDISDERTIKLVLAELSRNSG